MDIRNLNGLKGINMYDALSNASASIMYHDYITSHAINFSIKKAYGFVKKTSNSINSSNKFITVKNGE